MSDTTTLPPGASLGVGAIIGESFSILMRHFLAVVMLATIPTLIGLALSGLLTNGSVALGGEPTFTTGADAARYFISIVVQMATYGLTTALLVQLAYDAKLERSLHLSRYVGPAMRAALPIAVLTIVSTILFMIAAIALIVPGLWVYAVFSMMPAAVVIEKVGFGGLGRSAALTKEFRWPILGAMILIGIVNAAIGFVAVYLVGLFASSLDGGMTGVVVGMVLMSAITAIGYGLSSIAIALIYARLREIKEGASVRDIAAVFD